MSGPVDASHAELAIAATNRRAALVRRKVLELRELREPAGRAGEAGDMFFLRGGG